MRTARKVAESGFYHVVTKGEADQLLFLDDEDRKTYITALHAAMVDNDLLLHAYCLMSNHVHLLVEDRKQSLSAAMKQLNEQYAIHFRHKTKRTGHVFKNRFWSEPVESDEYLLCAMRYIHANPATAGICKASAYPWSSVRDYLGRDGITRTSLLLDMVGGRDGFIRFSRQEPLSALPFPTSKLRNHLTVDEARRIAESRVGELNDVASLPRDKRDDAIRRLLACGLETKMVSVVTGISCSTVLRVARTQKPLLNHH